MSGSVILFNNYKPMILHGNEGCESKTKHSVYDMHLKFWSVSSVKKYILYTGKHAIYSVQETLTPEI